MSKSKSYQKEITKMLLVDWGCRDLYSTRGNKIIVIFEW